MARTHVWLQCGPPSADKRSSVSGYSDTTLPTYARPPVAEVVVGMQFDRVPPLSNALLGGFWKSLPQNDWPAAYDAPFVPAQFEVFTRSPRWLEGPRLQLSSSPQCRIQIRHATQDRMIQVQNGRLYFNWQKKPGQEYPRFEEVIDGFVYASSAFADFLATANVGPVKPNHWEVTYVNRIPRNTVWATPADWDFFSLLPCIPSIENVVTGESFSGEWTFEIPRNLGRLHVRWDTLSQAKPDDSSDAIRLTLSARGPLRKDTDGIAAVLEGAQLGRKAIVITFRNLMSDKANAFWGLEQ